MFSNNVATILSVLNIRQNIPDMRGKVEGMAIFHHYFTNNHILVTRSSYQYYNHIIERRRAIIAYTQNINIWLLGIKFQILALIRDERIDIMFANPFALLSRPDIVAQIGALLCFIFGFIGESISLAQLYQLIFARSIYVMESLHKKSSFHRFLLQTRIL